MNCKNCGSEMLPEENYCSVCGAKKESSSYESYHQTLDGKKAKPTNANTTLLLGILSVVFVALNYIGVFFVHIIGIILGSVALNLAKKDKTEFNECSQTGRVLGFIGIFFGIIAMIIGALAASGTLSIFLY